MKKSAKTALAVTASAAALTAGAAAAVPYGIFKYIFGRPARSTKVPSFYKDSPHYKVSRAGMALMKTLPSEDAYINSRDGLRLHAYVFPAEQGTKKFILGIHGYKSYARPEFGPYIAFYRSLGYSMLLPDDRAHGPSEGKYIGFGVLDRLDCVDWAKYIVKTYGEDVEIILHGVSMGASTVDAAAGEADLPKQVKGVISDCGFTSAQDALGYQIENMAHLPAKRLLPKLEKICEKRAGFNFHDFSAVEQLKKARVPVLFVQGGQDNMVPPHMARELYDACASEKRLLMVENAGHAESIALAPEDYHKAVCDMFNIENPNEN